MDFADLHTYAQASRDAIGLLKDAYALLPKGVQRAQAEQAVAKAEVAIHKSDVEFAQALGYRLCECTFPPQIMLWKESLKARVCPNAECGRSIVAVNLRSRVKEVPRP